MSCEDLCIGDEAGIYMYCLGVRSVLMHIRSYNNALGQCCNSTSPFLRRAPMSQVTAVKNTEVKKNRYIYPCPSSPYGPCPSSP